MKIKTVIESKKKAKSPVVEEESKPENADEKFWAPNTYSFYSRTNRTIGIVGEITEQTANTVASQILQLQTDDPSSKITVFINTVGGDANAGFAIYDWLRSTSCSVVGIAYGRCSSAGIPIFMGADYRIAARNTRFFYHEVMQWGSAVSRKENKELFNSYEWYQEKMEEIIFARTKIKKRQFKKHFNGKTSFHFSNDLALELGFIHDEIEYVDRRIEIEGETYGKSRKKRKS